MTNIDPLDMQAIKEHEARLRRVQQEKLQTAILVNVCGDERLADIVRVFEAGDERRRETMHRMACALSKVREA